jgi:hypothetical protein
MMRDVSHCEMRKPQPEHFEGDRLELLDRQKTLVDNPCARAGTLHTRVSRLVGIPHLRP